jgi:hypothetical protein
MDYNDNDIESNILTPKSILKNETIDLINRNNVILAEILSIIKKGLSIVLLTLFTIPLVSISFYFAFNDSTCIHKKNRLGFNLFEYLIFDNIINLTLYVVTLIIILVYSCQDIFIILRKCKLFYIIVFIISLILCLLATSLISKTCNIVLYYYTICLLILRFIIYASQLIVFITFI